jgi:multidrug resistance efflux pump
MKKLYQNKAITKQQFDGIETKYLVTKAQYEQAKEKLELIEIGVREEDKRALQAQMERAKAMFELAQLKLKDTSVLAPFSGVITAKYHEEGEVIGVGMPVLQLVDFSKIKLHLPVSELYVNRVKTGLQAYFKTDYIPQKYFTGEVYEINPYVDPAIRNFHINILIQMVILQ